MSKTLDIDEVKGARKNIGDLVVFGNGDTFKLLCKASSKKEGWMKSTKVCNLPNGALVQVTTQQGDNVAEALTFAPDVNLYETPDGIRRLCAIKTETPNNATKA